MDCCEKTSKEKTDNKQLILWIVIGLLALATIYAVFFRDASVAQAASSAGASASSGMVGGC